MRKLTNKNNFKKLKKKDKIKEQNSSKWKFLQKIFTEIK